MKNILNFFALMLTVTLSGFAQNSTRFYAVSLFASRTVHSGQYVPTLSLSNGVIENCSSPYFADSISRRILWKPFDPATIGVQTACGLGAAGIVASVFIPLVNNAHDLGTAALAVVGGVAITSIVFPTGFYFCGKWMRGNGSYIWTVIGTLGVGGTAVLASLGSGSDASLFRTAIIGLEVGSILGYHLSASTVYGSDGDASSSMQPELKVKQGIFHEDVRLMILSIHL